MCTYFYGSNAYTGYAGGLMDIYLQLNIACGIIIAVTALSAGTLTLFFFFFSLKAVSKGK